MNKIMLIVACATLAAPATNAYSAPLPSVSESASEDGKSYRTLRFCSAVYMRKYQAELARKGSTKQSQDHWLNNAVEEEMDAEYEIGEKYRIPEDHIVRDFERFQDIYAAKKMTAEAFSKDIKYCEGK